MARAHTIWLVMNQNQEPLGAWTVKYQCQNYLQMTSPYKDQWRVWALGDGKPEKRHIMSVEEFLEE